MNKMSERNSIHHIAVPYTTIYKVNVKDLYNRYLNGHFDDIYPDFLKKSKLIKDNPIKSHIINHININGENTETVRTHNNSNSKEINECYYCRRNFKGDILGYIVDINYKTPKPTYYREDTLCSPSCVKAYLDYINLSARNREKYKDNTRRLFDILYPGMKIKKANDFRLLKHNSSNGEGLTDEEWEVPGHRYKMIQGISILSVDREFIKQKK